MKVIIIETGSGNIASVQNALNHLEIQSKISNKKKDLNDASHLILPGVGSYVNFMKSLKSLKLIDILQENVMKKKKTIPRYLCRYASFIYIWFRK